jgi:hypothetical protein
VPPVWIEQTTCRLQDSSSPKQSDIAAQSVAVFGAKPACTARVCPVGSAKSGSNVVAAEPPSDSAGPRFLAQSTLCRLQGGQFNHLNVDGKVYLCAKGQMLFRYSKHPPEFLELLVYPRV